MTRQHRNRSRRSNKRVRLPACMIERPSWASLLETAVREPGLVHSAYQQFHRYSLGNQLLAIVQCAQRGLPPGPLNTFVGWKELGRYVKKGEKALTLCMPVASKNHADGVERNPDVERNPENNSVKRNDEKTVTYTRFIYRPHWFVLSQTDGAAYQLPPALSATWEKERALMALGVTEVPFEFPDGNTQGYAQHRTIAINPVAALPYKTLFHELGHIELGHTSQNVIDGYTPQRSLRETEAESVAYLCVETLNLEGGVYARGYIQSWLRGETIPEASAQKIFAAADRILKAGRDGVHS